MNQHRNLLTAIGLLFALVACNPSGGVISTPTPADTVAPTVSLASSSTNVITASNITLTATASDNVGVTKVEFFDGATKLGEDTTAGDGFTQVVTLNSSKNGSRSYTAKAFDAAGNTKTSSAVVVTVAIVVDSTRPTLQSSSVLSNTSVRLVFSEPILGGNVAANFRLRLSDLTTPLAITAASVGVDGKTVTLTTAAQTKDEQYLLFVDNITDLAGNTFDQTNSSSLAFTIIGVGP